MLRSFAVALLLLAPRAALGADERPLGPVGQDKTAIVYIADGPIAGSRLFGGSLESLGKHGEWTGHVVCITDKPDCVEKLQKPRAEAAGIKLSIVPTERRSDLIEIKLQKAEVWSYLPKAGLTDIERVIYIDEDILIGKPIQGFIDILNSPLLVQRPMVMFKNSNVKTHFPHGGLMVSNRGAEAKSCLRQWAESMREQKRKRRNRWQYDQPALNRTDCRQSGRLHLLETGWESGVFAWPHPEDMEASKIAIFIHFTNNKRMKSSYFPKKVNKYFNEVLGLEGDPHKRERCSH